MTAAEKVVQDAFVALHHRWRDGGTRCAAASQPTQTWQPRGAWHGPWPPGLGAPAVWGQRLTVRLAGEGYRWTDTLAFGPPLHYQIPFDAFACGMDNPQPAMDLQPGQYAIPFSETSQNMLGQQELDDWPEVAFTGSGADSTVTDLRFTEMTHPDGSCAPQSHAIMSAHGVSIAYGLIGPLSLSQLRSLCFTAAPLPGYTGSGRGPLPLASLMRPGWLPGPVPSC